MKTKAKYTQQLIDTDSLPAVLRELKAEKEGLNVPVGTTFDLYLRMTSQFIITLITKKQPTTE